MTETFTVLCPYELVQFIEHLSDSTCPWCIRVLLLGKQCAQAQYRSIWANRRTNLTIQPSQLATHQSRK